MTNTTPETKLSLYSLTDELAQLLAVQEEMIENGENTDEISRQIVEYIAARIPERVDAAAHVSKHLKAQEDFAEAEEKRLKARKHFFSEARKRLHGYLVRVLEMLPEPKRGVRRLEGDVASIALYGNGGLPPLDLYEESLLPAEYYTFKIELSYANYLQALEVLRIPQVIHAERIVNEKLIRQHLALPCSACEGGKFSKPDAPCSACGGDGMAHIPGARLAPRGNHIRIV